MLTLSKPISEGQAQAYHRSEFANAKENYYTEGEAGGPGNPHVTTTVWVPRVRPSVGLTRAAQTSIPVRV